MTIPKMYKIRRLRGFEQELLLLKVRKVPKIALLRALFVIQTLYARSQRVKAAVSLFVNMGTAMLSKSAFNSSNLGRPVVILNLFFQIKRIKV